MLDKLQVSTISCTQVGDGSAGQCTLAWPSGTWTAAGTYEGEIEFTNSSGGIQTVNDLIKFICSFRFGVTSKSQYFFCSLSTIAIHEGRRFTELSDHASSQHFLLQPT